MVENLDAFYTLSKAEVPINITSELKETIDSINKALSDACQLASKQHIPGKLLVGCKLQKCWLCPHGWKQ